MIERLVQPIYLKSCGRKAVRVSLWVPALFVFLFFLSSFAVFAEPVIEKQVVKIGVIVPLTGNLAARGDDVAKLIPLVEKQVNEKSEKYRYKFLLDDGKGGAGNAPTTAVKKFLYVDKAEFMITGCSGESLQAGPIAQRNKKVTFAVFSTHQDVKNIGDYAFRTYVDIEHGIEHFARYMIEQTGGRRAELTEENTFTFGIQKLLHKYLGSHLIFTDNYSTETNDFNSLLTKITAQKPNGIFFNAMSEERLSTLVNQARALGINQKLYAFSMPDLGDFMGLTGKNSEGLAYIGSPIITDSTDDFKVVLKQFKNTYPKKEPYMLLLQTFYDAAHSIVDGVEAVGPDSTKVRDFLNTYSTNGALGKVEYDELGEIKNINFVLKIIKNGKRVSHGDLTKLQFDN